MPKIALTDATVYVYKDGKHIPKQTNVLIEDGRIQAIQQEVSPGYQIIPLDGFTLIPGHYDSHCHGGGKLYNPTTGIFNERTRRFKYSKANAKLALDEMLAAHAKFGSTAMHVSIMAVPEYRLKDILNITGKQYTNADNLLGVDIEGNYFFDNDNRAFTGAQNPDYFLVPNVPDFKRLWELSNKTIRRVCVGLERNDYYRARTTGDFLDYLRQRNIAIGLGHSGAREKTVLEEITRGGKFVYVHLGNALTKINTKQNQFRLFESVAESRYRAEGNAELYAELILDGVHIDDRFVLWAKYMFGKDKIIGVTDNIGITGTPPVPRFRILGTPAVVTAEQPDAVWVEGHVGEILCGSNATMDRILSNYMRILMDDSGKIPIFLKEPHEPMEFADAMDWSLHALCTNPANLYYAPNHGTIEVGKVASLVALDATNHKKIQVKRVWVAGEEVNLT